MSYLLFIGDNFAVVKCSHDDVCYLLDKYSFCLKLVPIFDSVSDFEDWIEE